MKYKVSVIVPVYQSEKTLKKCIESLLNQTMLEIQIILVDDGSTDGSETLCDEYKIKDSRISVIHQKNKGAGVARNKGLKIAKGDYIGFVDSDDWIDTDMYKNMYQIATENDIDVIRCNTLIHRGNQIEECWTPECVDQYLTGAVIKEKIIPLLIAPEKEGDYKERLLKGCVCCLFKKKVIDNNTIAFQDIKNGQDAIFSMEAMWHAKSMILLKTPYYHYIKQESGSLSVSMKKFRNYEQRNESRKLIDKLVIGSPYEEIFYERWKQEDRRYIYLDARIATIYNSTASKKDKLKLLKEVVTSSECKEAFSEPIKDKLPLQLFVLYFLLSHKMYRILYCFISIKFKKV